MRSSWLMSESSVWILLAFTTIVGSVSAAKLDTTVDSGSKSNELESSTPGSTVDECRIPASWHGDWYEYNQFTGGTSIVSINETDISSANLQLAGRCGRISAAAAGGGGYKHEKESELLLTSRDRSVSGSQCWLCMLVFDRHHNILQYRISQKCASDPDLACHTVDVNSPMRIMFRADAAVEPCPVTGPANFSFSTVSEEKCDTQKSTIGGCVDESRLRLNYIACPNVRMESHVDDLVCIGKFEAFNKKYFVAKMINRASAGSDGDLLRCFTYETTPSGGHLMVSGDASCQSLDNGEASVKIKYTSVDSAPRPDCQFRSWLRHRHRNKETEIAWESLSSSTAKSATGERHVFDRHKWTVERASAATGGAASVQTINWCVHYVSDHKEEKATTVGDGTRLERLIIYSIDECERGYRCAEFYHHPKRNRNQVMDVIVGKFAPTSFEACKPEYFDKTTMQFETLIDAASREQECPTEHRGQYRIRGCEENDAALYLGCGEGLGHSLIFYEDCNQKDPGVYHCYGDWTDPENPYVHYLAVKDTSSGKKTCFAYARTSEDDELAVSTFRQHSCKRGILPGINGHKTYNLTKTGLCDKIPWRVANLTQSDASARYDESSLFARSVNGRRTNDASVERRATSVGFIAIVAISVLLLRNGRG